MYLADFQKDWWGMDDGTCPERSETTTSKPIPWISKAFKLQGWQNWIPRGWGDPKQAEHRIRS